MISEAYKKELVNRFKSLLWKILGMAISAILAFILNEVKLMSLPIEVVALIGLIISEITKFLYVSFPKLKEAGERLFEKTA